MPAKTRPISTEDCGFLCDGIVLSERKKEEERGALSLSSTTLALSPAWLARGNWEKSGCQGGELENREKERRIGEERPCSLEMVTWFLHFEFTVSLATKKGEVNKNLKAVKCRPQTNKCLFLHRFAPLYLGDALHSSSNNRLCEHRVQMSSSDHETKQDHTKHSELNAC